MRASAGGTISPAWLVPSKNSFLLGKLWYPVTKLGPSGAPSVFLVRLYDSALGDIHEEELDPLGQVAVLVDRDGDNHFPALQNQIKGLSRGPTIGCHGPLRHVAGRAGDHAE